MMSAQRCPDCGDWTTRRLCDECAQVAASRGFTVEERLAMLWPTLFPATPDLRSSGWSGSEEPFEREGLR